MIELHLYVFMCAVIGYVYSIVLTEPDQVLYPVWKFLDRILHPVIFKPVMDCYKCVAGQIALWFYLVEYGALSFKVTFFHIYFICLTIFISIMLNKIYERIKGN